MYYKGGLAFLRETIAPFAPPGSAAYAQNIPRYSVARIGFGTCKMLHLTCKGTVNQALLRLGDIN